MSDDSDDSDESYDYIMYECQGAFLAGGDVIIPDYAAEKYGRVAKLLNWTVLDNYHNHSVAE